jgi:hypothetical protein
VHGSKDAKRSPAPAPPRATLRCCLSMEMPGPRTCVVVQAASRATGPRVEHWRTWALQYWCASRGSPPSSCCSCRLGTA